MKALIVKPDGWPCTFGECPPGFFAMADDPESEVYLKTEYSSNESPDKYDAYCSSGEYFWGGTDNSSDRNKLIVQPVIIAWETIDN